MGTMQANGSSFEEWDAAVRGEEQRAMGVGKSPVAAVLAFSLGEERTRVGRAEETTVKSVHGVVTGEKGGWRRVRRGSSGCVSTRRRHATTHNGCDRGRKSEALVS